MIGTQVGKYRIESELGRGGMGVVYQGLHTTLERRVAIKMLPAHIADGDTRARFRREALTLARLAHPNIVSIFDVEELDGHSFIVMEFAGGGSLGDLMARGAELSPTRATEIMVPVLSALQAAHLAGVVHRDIKPDNILFTDTGRPKLTDFGVAHMRDGGSRTRTGVMLGTPYYMSPEQAQGRPVSAAADIYAVGIVLFEMLSGRVPFTGQDPVTVALKHVQETPPSLFEIRPDLPFDLCALVHRAIEKDPAARFTSAAAMQDALEAGPWSPVRTLDPASSGSRPAAVPHAGAPASPVRDETRPLPRPSAGGVAPPSDATQPAASTAAGDPAGASHGGPEGASHSESAGPWHGGSEGASHGESAGPWHGGSEGASHGESAGPSYGGSEAASGGGAAGVSSGAAGALRGAAGTASGPGASGGAGAHPRAAAAAGGASGAGASGPHMAAGGRGLPQVDLDRAAEAARAGLAGVGATSRGVMAWLQRPGPRGLPMAFWAGATALALAFGWMGADALTSSPGGARGSDAGPPPSNPTSTSTVADDSRASGDDDASSSTGNTPSSLAGRTRVNPRSSDAGVGNTARDLTPEEVAILADMASGRDRETPGDSVTSTVIDDLDIVDDRIRPEDLRGPDDTSVDDTPETRVGPPTAATSRRDIRAIIDRQLASVASENRAGFLRDFHPSRRAEAAREFDDANAGVTNFRSTTSNLDIEFLDPSHALVTFDVDFSFVVRADGRTIRDSEQESWEVVWEDDRWWILEWD